MNFWERVDDLLDRKGMTKKTLSQLAGFDPSNISKGLKMNNIPSADTAVKIAQVLGVSVEYLVNGRDTRKKNVLYVNEKSPEYKTLFSEFQTLPPEKQDIVKNLIENLKNI